MLEGLALLIGMIVISGVFIATVCIAIYGIFIHPFTPHGHDEELARRVRDLEVDGVRSYSYPTVASGWGGSAYSLSDLAATIGTTKVPAKRTKK